MMDLLPAIIVLASFMVGLGYAVGNVQGFSVLRLVPAGVVLWMLSQSYDMGMLSAIVIAVSLGVGYLWANLYLLEALTETIGIYISNLRYRKAYEDIRRQETEVDALCRQYEAWQQEQQRQQREEQQQQRKQQSDSFREKQQSQKQQSYRKNKYSDTNSNKSSNSKGQGSSTRGRNLQILGLDPNGNYSYSDIKKAYRRQASQCHPDKHHGTDRWDEMTKRFQEVQKAYEWLGKA